MGFLHPSKQFFNHVIPVNNFSVMSGCVCENIHHLCMGEELIFFYGHLVTCGKKKTMMSIFYWLAERAVIIFCPEKSIGALIGGGGT